MNCFISIALLLVSLTAGMWLLYKTQKENISTFFKVVAWFIIVVSFLLMICCAMHGMMRCCAAINCCKEGKEGYIERNVTKKMLTNVG